MLTSGVKKGHTYYWNQSRSQEKVSISENLLFKKVGEFIEEIDRLNPVIQDIDKKTVLNFIKQESYDI